MKVLIVARIAAKMSSKRSEMRTGNGPNVNCVAIHGDWRALVRGGRATKFFIFA